MSVTGKVYMEGEHLLKVGEIAALLRVTPSWVYANADFLGAYRIGKYLRFSREEVFKRLKNDRVPTLGSQPNDSSQGT